MACCMIVVTVAGTAGSGVNGDNHTAYTIAKFEGVLS